MARAARLVAHLLLSAVGSPWLLLTRRGAPLVFTHAGDMQELRDGSLRDLQMGPLTEHFVARGERFLEVCLVSLDGGLRRCLRSRRRLFLPQTAMLALGRLLAGRRRAAACWLWLFDPPVLFLIDESGSGQAWLQAARAQGRRCIAVQHGDFQPDNRQYASAHADTRGVRAADVLALWSPWFARRLHALSTVYDGTNTAVVGRLCHAGRQPVEREADAAGPLRVLLLGQPQAEFARRVAPFVAALRADPNVELRLRPHPVQGTGDWPASERLGGTLAAALGWCELALGVSSSALLEALWFERPALCLLGPDGEDAAGYVDQAGLEGCADPSELLTRCAELRRRDAETLSVATRARQRVWGDAPEDPVGALLDLARPILNPSGPDGRKSRPDPADFGRRD